MPTGRSAIWLKPFRGFPDGRWLPAMDLVYLDENCRVLEGIQFSPDFHSAPLRAKAESVLVLPPHTLYSTQTFAGDQLIICAAEELALLLSGKLHPDFATQPNLDSSSSTAESPNRRVVVPVQSKEQTTRAQTSGQRLAGQSGECSEETRDSTIKGRFLRWLCPESDRRRTMRFYEPNLDAYYWTGGAPEPHKIRDIGYGGFYMFHDQRWPIGTTVQMTLQRPGASGESSTEWISVESKVVGWGPDGMSFEFSSAESEGRHRAGGTAKKGMRLDIVEGFLARLDLVATTEASQEALSQAG